MGWKKMGKVAVVCLLTVCNILLLSSCGKKLVSPESYVLDADSISSITAVLGEERELSDITELMAQEEGEETEKVVQKSYTYVAADTKEADIEAYITFLTNVRGCVLVAPIEEGSNLESYICASAEAGMVFQLDIKRTDDGYTLAIQRREGEILKPVEKEEQSEKEERNDSGVISREDALSKLQELSPEDLKLPYPIDSYVITYDEGRSIINNRECYGIHAFLKREDKRMENMGIYYVACDGTAVYHYSAETDTFANIGPILPPKPLEEPEEEKPKVDPAPGTLTAKMLNYSPEAAAKEEEEQKHRDIDPGTVTAAILNQVNEETEGEGGAAAGKPAAGASTDKNGTGSSGAKGSAASSSGKPIAVKQTEIAPGDLTAEDLNR